MGASSILRMCLLASVALFGAPLLGAPETPVPCIEGALTKVSLSAHGAVAHLGAELQEAAPSLYEEAARYTGATGCAPISLHLTADNDAARALFPAWHLPPWAAGAAHPEERTVVLTVHTDGLRHDRLRVLLHELAHLATAAANPTGRALPRWFEEGVARRLAGEDGQDDDAVLARAKLAGGLLPLEGLEESFPGSAHHAAVAYAVAGRALGLLEQRQGHDVVRRILAALPDGRNFEDSLLRVTGLTSAQLSLHVERSVTTWQAWLTVVRQVDVWLGFGGLLLLWAGGSARRRTRQRIARMPDEGGPEHDFPELGLVRWRTGR